jgi:hypothetical protein
MACIMLRSTSVLGRLRAHWSEFRHWPAGQRFTRFYERQRSVSSRWAAPLIWLAALLAVGIGVVLVFIPGPAVVFFAVAVALLASQSRWLAQHLDVAEVRLRRLWETLRRKHARRPEGRER